MHEEPGTNGPAVAERLLAGFVADPDLEEAVLGDLAEEWGERAVDDGIAAANGWYRGQALRTAPHLLVAWWRGAGPGELRRTLGRAAVALAAALLLAGSTAGGAWIASGGGTGGAPLGSGPHLLALALVLAGAGWALAAGFGLAHRTRRAPMAATAVLAVGWIPATLVPVAAFPASSGAPVWLCLAFPVATVLATVAGGTAATLLERPAGASRPRSDPPTFEAAMTKKTDTTPFRRRAARVAVATALLLAVPLVAMQLTDEVVWTVGDFLFAGALLMGVGLTYAYAATKTERIRYRSGVGVALAAAFLLVWANGAVGVIGSEANPANLMYAGVLAVGLAGVFVARFEPRGMARAMVATAAAQALVTAIAIAYGLGEPWSGPLELAALNGFWIVLWLGSAWLFRGAGREREPARATVRRPGSSRSGRSPR